MPLRLSHGTLKYTRRLVSYIITEFFLNQEVVFGYILTIENTSSTKP